MQKWFQRKRMSQLKKQNMQAQSVTNRLFLQKKKQERNDLNQTLTPEAIEDYFSRSPIKRNKTPSRLQPLDKTEVNLPEITIGNSRNFLSPEGKKSVVTAKNLNKTLNPTELQQEFRRNLF